MTLCLGREELGFLLGVLLSQKGLCQAHRVCHGEGMRVFSGLGMMTLPMEMSLGAQGLDPPNVGSSDP